MFLGFLTQIFGPAFFITMGLIFFAAITMVLLEKRKKDRALKIFHNYHAIIIMESGLTMWGIIKVFKNSLEIMYDQPYTTDGSTKNSYILYNSDLDNIQIIMRYLDNLDKDKKEKREKQIKKLLKKRWFIRIYRSIANFFNRLKDAVRKAVMLAIGQVYRYKKIDKWAEMKREGEQVGSEVINTIEDNLYEPILEQYIGKPVAVDIICSAASSKFQNIIIEIQGYLVDYSNRFITIINKEPKIDNEEIIELKDDIKNNDYSIKTLEDIIIIQNEGRQPLLIENVNSDEILSKILLIQGSFVKFKKINKPVFKINKIQRMDVIVPRDLAKVRHSLTD